MIDHIDPGIDLDIIVILTVDQGSVGEQPAAENMIPPESNRRIPIIKAKSIAQAQLILSKIPGQVDMIFLTKLVIRLDIGIVKIKAAPVRVSIF